MPGHTQSRRERGRVQNLANQLAQLTVGWEFMPEGRVLRTAPDVGVLTLDVVGNSAFIEGQLVDSGILSVARGWLSAELMRLHRNPDWVRSATVDVSYELRREPPAEDASSSVWGHAELHSVARITTGGGEAEATFANRQGVLDPGEHPLRSMYQAVHAELIDARSRIDWQDQRLNPDRLAEGLAEVELYEWIFRFLQVQPSSASAPVFERRPTAVQLLRARRVVGIALAALETGQPSVVRLDRDAARHREALSVARRLLEPSPSIMGETAHRAEITHPDSTQ